MAKPSKAPYPAIKEVAELFDVQVLSDMEEDFQLAAPGEETDQSKFHTVYALGSRTEYAAGLRGHIMTPWFETMVLLENFCRRHLSRFQEIAATQAASGDYEGIDATDWDRNKTAEMIHSDSELGQKMEPAILAPETSPSQTELEENSHADNGASPTLDGDLHSPERANVNAMREALEGQAEWEVGKPIREIQEKVKADAVNSNKADATPVKQIIINVANKNDEPIGGEDKGKITSGHGGGMFGGTDLEGPEFHAVASWDYPAKKAAFIRQAAYNPHTGDKARPESFIHKDFFDAVRDPNPLRCPNCKSADIDQSVLLKPNVRCNECEKKWQPGKTAFIKLEDLQRAGREYLKRIRTAAVGVSQGEDAQGFHMNINLGGREYVLRGEDAHNFRKEYAAIMKPENKVNALVEKYMWKLQPYKPAPKSAPKPAKAPALQGGIPEWLRQKEQEDAYSKRKMEPEYVSHRSSKQAADQMKCPWCGEQATRSSHEGTFKCTKCPWEQRKAANRKKAADGESPDYWGYDNWITGHTASLIDNDSVSLNTKYRLAKNAIKKKIGIDQLAGQFSRLFQKQFRESAEFYEQNAVDAREERGAYERQQLEGMEPESTGNEAQDTANRLFNMGYDMGMRSGWEEPMGEVDWKAIAQSAIDQELEDMKYKEQQKSKKEPVPKDELDLTDRDKQLMKEMGIQSALSVPDQHQLKIAIQTLKAPDAMAGIMGGMDKQQALQVLAKHGLRWDDKDYMSGGGGVKKAADTTKEQRKFIDTPSEGTAEERRAREQRVVEKTQKENSMKPKEAGKGKVKNETELEKEAGFNFFFPGQVLKEFYPEIQHEIVDYPNANNTPMGVHAPEMVGEPDQQNLDAMIEQAFDGMGAVEAIQLPADVGEIEDVHMSADYSSTSPAGGMGIGRDGKPEILEGAPLRKENDIRGYMFTDEFHQQYDSIPGSSLQTASKNAAGSNSGEDDVRGKGDLWREEFYQQHQGGPSAESVFKTAADKTDVEQFGMFLKRVCGEIAATFTSAFKTTSRPLLDKVPGVGEVQLAQVEQPQGMSSFNIVNTGSRVKNLLDKLTDSEIRDAINDAWAQSAVWNDSTKGGYIYEVFVRMESIDTDSMIAKYRFVTGTRE